MVSLKSTRKLHTTQHASNISASKVIRRRSRKLASLLDLPYDMVVEILGHLHPYDLLRLARTSRVWRRSLMSRSSESIWRLARERLEDMPDCPSDMSEPEYANLMFSTHCHYCIAPRVHLVIWTTRCRACKACFPTYYKRSMSLRFNLDYFHLPVEAWKFVELQGNIVHSSTYAPITSRDRPRKIASLELLEELTKQFNKIQGQPHEIQHWLKQKEEERQHKTRMTDAFEEWHERQRQKRSEKLESIREKRKDMIVQKLEGIGWKEEIAAMDIDRLRSHEKVHVARELTESAWMNIAPALCQFMDDVKAERLERLRTQQITSRRHIFSNYLAELEHEISTMLPGYAFAVPATDLSLVPSVRDIIERTPFDQTITLDTFHPVREQLREMSLGWAVYQSLELLKIMPRSAEDTSNNQISRLWLATTFFKCEHIRGPISYPEILTHPGTSSYYSWRCNPKPEEKQLFEDFRQEFYNKNRISFCGLASQAARRIIEICNLDPGVTTTQDMDAFNPFIGCASCRNASNPLNGTLIMTWRRAVIHALEHNLLATQPLWVLLRANIQADWYNEALNQVQKEGLIYRCHLCNEHGNRSFIWAHLALRHQFLVPTRIRLFPDPPSAFWAASPITNILGAY